MTTIQPIRGALIALFVVWGCAHDGQPLDHAGQSTTSEPIEPTTSALLSGCVPLPGTLTPDFCRQLEASGRINVLCAYDGTDYVDYTAPGALWASPDDTCDDTAAIQQALSRAWLAKEVYLPVAEVDGNFYMVSAPLNLSGRRMVGQLHMSSKRGSRIRFAGAAPLRGRTHELPPPAGDDPTGYAAGALVYSLGAPAQLEDLVLECEGMVDYGVYYYRAHGKSSRVRNVRIEGAVEAGLYSDSTGVAVFESITANQNLKDGIVFVGPNGNSAYDLAATYNGRHGIVIARRVGGQSGGMSLSGGNVEINGNAYHCSTSTPCGGIFVLDTVTPVRVENVWVEGNIWHGVYGKNAHSLSVVRNLITGASAGQISAESINHSIDLTDCQHPTVRGNAIATNNFFNYEDIWLRGDHRYATVTENIYDSGGGATHYIGGTSGSFDVVLTDALGLTIERLSQHQQTTLRAHSPPSVGRWLPGDMVWNNSPAPGEAAGWMCSTTAMDQTCAVWLSIGTLSNLP